MLRRITRSLSGCLANANANVSPPRIVRVSSNARMPSVNEPRSSLQATLDVAKTYAASIKHGQALPPASAEHLSQLLGSIPLGELGFSDKSVQDPSCALPESLAWHSSLADIASAFIGRPANDQTVTFLEIYESDILTLGIFCFPAGTAIPLHDHPGMTVLSRLLFGTLRVRSYDWLPDEKESEAAFQTPGIGEKREARQVASMTVRAPEPGSSLMLFPKEGGNLHELTAETPCAVLDLLVPPYRPYEGVDCTYYREVSGAARIGGAVMLEAIRQPSSFSVRNTKYKGVQVK